MAGRAIVAILTTACLLGGCGRIGYELGGLEDDGSTGPDTGTGDAAAGARDAQAEADGGPGVDASVADAGQSDAAILDAGDPMACHAAVCPCVGPPVQVTRAGRASEDPSIAWTGEGLALAWLDARDGSDADVYVTLLDPFGAHLTSEHRLAASGVPSGAPSVTVLGGHVLVVWPDEIDSATRALHVVSSDLALTTVSAPRMAIASSSPITEVATAATGSELGVLWTESAAGATSIHFQRLAADGSRLGTPAVVSDVGYGPALTWSGAAFGASFTQRERSDEAFFALISDGVPGRPDMVTPGSGISFGGGIASAGGSFLVTLRDNQDFPAIDIYAQLYDASGSQSGAEVRVSNEPALSERPSIAAGGGGYGVAWHDDRVPGGQQLFVAALDASGNRTSAEVQISSLPAVGRSAIAWIGDSYVVVWASATAADNTEIFFARICF